MTSPSPASRTSRPRRARPTRRRRPAAVGTAVLVAVALAVLALSACGTGDATPRATVTVTPTVTYTPPPPTATTTTTAPVKAPQTYDDALTHVVSAPLDSAAVQGFTSPSGNIYCDIYAGSSTRGCELKSGRIAPPTSDYCPAGSTAKDIGQVVFAAAGPVAVCNSTSVVKAGVPALKYGAATRSGALTCVSETIGVTCIDAGSRTGFFLARSMFYIF